MDAILRWASACEQPTARKMAVRRYDRILILKAVLKPENDTSWGGLL